MCGASWLRRRGINPGYLALKLTLGVFSTLFWLLGLLILCIGIYAEVERQQNKTMDSLFLAPAIILLLLGLSMFTVSFAGMVGALRDNRLLLKVVLLLFKANVREGIKHYYDDLDFKNILDRIQVKGDVINTQCGYQTLHKERFEVDTIIYVRGCVDAISLWFMDNIGITVGILAALLLPQVIGIVLSCLYLKTLSQHKDEFDGFRIPYELLDLSGAGWCLCLPREEGYQPVERAESNADTPDAVSSVQEMQPMNTEQEVN
ncbi:tetraspanin-15 isoform X6 [Carcharodon carcharias]|uniref:tetraspanin-15 isoform X6 n=1 Tax=Carcharodon carcharias TaxID=13397 RepID=UPI001B7E3332|nr:tetraspanin-15 isoform X6 [Carcharodon carcharias]